MRSAPRNAFRALINNSSRLDDVVTQLTALPASELLGQRARQCGRPRVSQ
jgi:hypothetical protein